MLVTIAVVLCQLATDLCVEKVVTDTSMSDQLTMQSCMLGQAAVAEWVGQHPIYHTGWRVARVKCVLGPYKTPRDA